MTLSTLAMNRKKKRKTATRLGLTWLLTAFVAAAFSGIYEYFSFGVYSMHMIFVFAYPLLLGALPCFVLGKLHKPMPSRIYNDGVLLLMFGSMVTGILEIYGTTSPYTSWYFYGGFLLLGIGVIQLAMEIIRNQS